MKKLALILLLIVSYAGASAQNNLCSGADPFCTTQNYSFPAGVNSGTAEPGPNYGCLGTQPNPAWYFLQIAQAGPIDITMQSTPLVDIDFICYGPFSSLTGACNNLTAGNTVDCSYSTAATEYCNIPNAQVGEFYLLLITNYSNAVCDVNFSQTGGTGATDCSILAPPVSNNGPLCDGELLQLTAGTIPGATYTWSGPNGFSSTTQNPVINPATLSNSGTYMLIVSDGVTTDTSFTTVQIYPVPTAVVTYTDTLCAGGTVSLQGSGSAPGPGNNLLYQYDLDNNGVYEITASTGDTVMSSYFVIAGTYTVGFRVTSPGGCYDEVDFTIRVFANPTVTLNANPLEVCKGTEMNLSAIGNIIYPPSLPSPIDLFTWDFDHDGITDATDAGTGSNNSKTSIQSVNYTTPGIYNATVVVTSTGGCSGKDSIELIVHDQPQAGFTSSTVCLGQQTTLTDTSNVAAPDVIDSYSWTITDGGSYNYTASQGSVNLDLPTTGSYTATVIVVTNAGCSDTAQSTIQVYPQPVADFSFVTGCFSHNTLMDASTDGTEPYALAWDLNNDGINDTSGLEVFEYIFPDSSDQNVTLSLVDANGCKDTVTILVDVKGGVSDPLMPNMMKLSSALGNNKLDFQQFAPGFNDCIDYTIAIYNRWGTMIYEATNETTNPDLMCAGCFTGHTTTGSTIEPGTYYYVLRGIGNNGQYDIEKNGTITVFE
jgi:hypothetical protein